VEAAGPLRALSLPATAFRALVDAEPAVARRLAALLTSRLRQAQSEWALLANGPEEADPLARLTPAEQRVALLVADGLSNAQIADRLVLSRHTVDSHVKHALAKLGVRNRVALATVVSRG
jgi:DNA-binding NarL/FixJ family response regulator